MNATATYETMHAAHEGRKVEFKGIAYTIGALSDRMGKLKTGDEKAYVQLIAADEKDNIEMHPRKAVDLFTKGEAEGIKLLVEQVAAEGEMKATPTEVVSHPEVAQTTATTEVATAGATTPAATEVVAKAPSKKEQCVAFYHNGVAAKLDRKTILAQFATVGVTGPGAATYYQNCKSAKAGWTMPVVVAEPAAVEAVASTEVAAATGEQAAA
jgi:hypothetical protein